MSLTALFTGFDMHAEVGILLVHGNNFDRMPFLPAPYGYQRELDTVHLVQSIF